MSTTRQATSDTSARTTPTNATIAQAPLERLGVKNGVSRITTNVQIRMISPTNGRIETPGSFQPGIKGKPIAASKLLMEFSSRRSQSRHRRRRAGVHQLK